MPSYVVKVNKHENRYVIWSTVTDSPLFWGNESETLDYLLDLKASFKILSADMLHEAAERIYRAKANGTSAIDMDYSWGDGFIFKQKGFLRRDNLGAFLDSFTSDTYTFDETLLEPFENDS